MPVSPSITDGHIWWRRIDAKNLVTTSRTIHLLILRTLQLRIVWHIDRRSHRRRQTTWSQRWKQGDFQMLTFIPILEHSWSIRLSCHPGAKHSCTQGRRMFSSWMLWWCETHVTLPSFVFHVTSMTLCADFPVILFQWLWLTPSSLCTLSEFFLQCALSDDRSPWDYPRIHSSYWLDLSVSIMKKRSFLCLWVLVYCLSYSRHVRFTQKEHFHTPIGWCIRIGTIWWWNGAAVRDGGNSPMIGEVS